MLAHYKGSLARALVSSYPNIGLEVSRFAGIFSCYFLLLKWPLMHNQAER